MKKFLLIITVLLTTTCGFHYRLKTNIENTYNSYKKSKNRNMKSWELDSLLRMKRYSKIALNKGITNLNWYGLDIDMEINEFRKKAQHSVLILPSSLSYFFSGKVGLHPYSNGYTRAYAVRGKVYNFRSEPLSAVKASVTYFDNFDKFLGSRIVQASFIPSIPPNGGTSDYRFMSTKYFVDITPANFGRAVFTVLEAK